MPTFKIMGKIEPPWLRFTLNFVPEVSYRIEEVDIDLRCSISIANSEVAVTCDANRWGQDVLNWSLPYIFDWVGAEVDLFTFASGNVLHVHLDRAEHPDGSNHMLIETAPDLSTIATACAVIHDGGTLNVEMRDLLPIIIGNPTLMLALRDLVSALKHGNNSLTNCGRAIEAIRKSLWGRDERDNAEERRAWEHLRTTLRISRAYLQTITDASRGPRHGSSAYVSSGTRQEVLRRSWAVMNRFLLYRLRGSQPLTENEFPLLETAAPYLNTSCR